MSKLLNHRFTLLLFLLITALSCSDDDDTEPVPVASFTSAADAANPLKINFTNTSTNGKTFEWDFGDGGTSTEENPSHTYASSGNYTVTLTAKSGGGSNEKSETVTIAAVEVNLLQGSDMSAANTWTIENAGMSETSAEFKDGKLVFSNPANSQTNIKVYQAVNVEAGKEYTFSAKIKGQGATNSWVEVLFGTEAPVDGADYSNGLYTGLNTWDGCGTAAFDANLAAFGCKANAPGNGKNGKITFANSGTIYLVLKAGSWDGTLGTGGIEIDDVKLVKFN